MSESKSKKDDLTSFTVDHDLTGPLEMPSITKLLNRKSLKLPKPSQSTQPEIQETLDLVVETLEIEAGNSSSPPISLEPTESQEAIQTSRPPKTADEPISISVNTDNPAPMILELSSTPVSEPKSNNKSAPQAERPSHTQIRRTTRKKSLPTHDLVQWDPKTLKAANDPLGQGIAIMLEKGVTSALFLSIQPPPPQSPVPLFRATAAVRPGDKLEIWQGLHWDPRIVPEMWNYFIKSGLVELPPPGAVTNRNSHRNVVRASFGLSSQEWILILRVGPATACRGVIALISLQTVLTEIQDAIPLISKSPP